MKRIKLQLLLFATLVLLAVAGCTSTQPDAPKPDPKPDPKPNPTAPAITPTGPIDVRVGTVVTFEAIDFSGAVVWAVNDVPGGTPATGTIAAGRYQAPARVPADAVVTVSATSEADPDQRASATVTITAPGTLYVLDEKIYVYGNLDTVGGNVAPDRTFTLAGTTSRYWEMTMAPALDMAFISTVYREPRIFRVENISSASGEVAGTIFSTLSYDDPGGMAYDQQRDTLYVVLNGALVAYEEASTAAAGTEPTRIVAGPSIDSLFETNGRLALDAAADRVYFSHAEGLFVGVYDNASTIDGEITPDRTINVDVPNNSFFWGMSYDPSRDQLYLGNQRKGVGVYVVAEASEADGQVAPDRSIGGTTNPIVGASQVDYDVAHDRLVVIDSRDDNVKVYDNASTLNGDVAPSRVIGGAMLPLDYPYGGYIDPTQ